MAGVDTAVVGAGLIGLATAHALCRDGQGRVALFDRGLPGSGDSGRSFSSARNSDWMAVAIGSYSLPSAWQAATERR